MKNVVVIYDGDGQIQNTRYDLEEPPMVYSIKVELAENEYVDNIDTLQDIHVPVIKTFEKSRDEQLADKVESLEAQILYLKMINELNGGSVSE